MILLTTYLALVAALAVGVGLLHLIPRLGPVGSRLADAMAHAPLLDVVIALLTVAPWVVALIVGSWVHDGFGWAMLYLLIAIAAQYTVLVSWCRLHGWAHRETLGGPRLVKSLNRAVGPLRNYVAVYWTAMAVPLFNLIRLVEYVVYPPLTKIIGLPTYNDRDWVNVSRHKFEGLVGGDRVWCLYCDWMTGVWSLGSEMLRNIESFWCPIRFRSDLKCENCKLDFPDVDGTGSRPTVTSPPPPPSSKKCTPAPTASTAGSATPAASPSRASRRVQILSRRNLKRPARQISFLTYNPELYRLSSSCADAGRCRPHSCLRPLNRPARSSCPAVIGWVECQSPMLAYPASCSGWYGRSCCFK